MSDTVLVTGAGGFIGRRLVERLQAEGCRVRALVRKPRPGVFPAGVEMVSGDVRFRETIAPALDGCAAVFHLAARMGGHGGFVAGLVTLSTLAAMAGLPLALLALRLLR